MGDPWAQFGKKASSMVQVGKALSVMGYSNWSALEPGKWFLRCSKFNQSNTLISRFNWSS